MYVWEEAEIITLMTSIAVKWLRDLLVTSYKRLSNSSKPSSLEPPDI